MSVLDNVNLVVGADAALKLVRVDIRGLGEEAARTAETEIRELADVLGCAGPIFGASQRRDLAVRVTDQFSAEAARVEKTAHAAPQGAPLRHPFAGRATAVPSPGGEVDSILMDAALWASNDPLCDKYLRNYLMAHECGHLMLDCRREHAMRPRPDDPPLTALRHNLGLELRDEFTIGLWSSAIMRNAVAFRKRNHLDPASVLGPRFVAHVHDLVESLHTLCERKIRLCGVTNTGGDSLISEASWLTREFLSVLAHLVGLYRHVQAVERLHLDLRGSSGFDALFGRHWGAFTEALMTHDRELGVSSLASTWESLMADLGLVLEDAEGGLLFARIMPDALG